MLELLAVLEVKMELLLTRREAGSLFLLSLSLFLNFLLSFVGPRRFVQACLLLLWAKGVLIE